LSAYYVIIVEKSIRNITRSLHSFLVQERYQKHICTVKFKILSLKKASKLIKAQNI